MKTVAEVSDKVLKKFFEINKLIMEWGYTNPRIFRSVFEKDLGRLNILVKPIGRERGFYDSLAEDLETLLQCHVDICPESQLDEDCYNDVMQNARGLEKLNASELKDLLDHCSKNHQFGLPNADSQQEYLITSRKAARASLVEERKKRKRAEGGGSYKDSTEPDSKKPRLTPPTMIRVK